MKILGLDLETQGLEDSTRITQVGARLVEMNDVQTLDPVGRSSFSSIEHLEALCYESDYPPQPPEIVELTGITDVMLQRGGNPRRFVLEKKLFPMLDKAEVVLIHNKQFDWNILNNNCKQIGLLLPKKEIVCTRSDIDWGPKFTSRRLQHLCIDHKMHFDPKKAHTALFDVDLMLELVSHYKISNILKFAREPWVIYQALILGPWDGNGGDGGRQRDIAKKIGFSYEKIPYDNNYFFSKAWIKKTKASKLEEIYKLIDASESPFELKELEVIKNG